MKNILTSQLFQRMKSKSLCISLFTQERNGNKGFRSRCSQTDCQFWSSSTLRQDHKTDHQTKLLKTNSHTSYCSPSCTIRERYSRNRQNWQWKNFSLRTSSDRSCSRTTLSPEKLRTVCDSYGSNKVTLSTNLPITQKIRKKVPFQDQLSTRRLKQT